jgi:hypothetical protein
MLFLAHQRTKLEKLLVLNFSRFMKIYYNKPITQEKYVPKTKIEI